LHPEIAPVVEQKKKELAEAFYPLIRRLLLQTVDFLWVDHLESMEYLRSSVNLRAYGQRDPLVEYKKEGLLLFQSMENAYSAQIASVLPNVAVQNSSPQAQAAVQKAAMQITATGHNTGKKEYGRNDRVIITNGSETRELKYKKAEPLIQSSEWKILES
jgi:preprotein translocase subunit SecA